MPVSAKICLGLSFLGFPEFESINGVRLVDPR